VGNLNNNNKKNMMSGYKYLHKYKKQLYFFMHSYNFFYPIYFFLLWRFKRHIKKHLDIKKNKIAGCRINFSLFLFSKIIYFCSDKTSY
jgi:hypothetical protein